MLQLGLQEPGPIMVPLYYVVLALGLGLLVAYLVHLHHLSCRRKEAASTQGLSAQTPPAEPPLAPAPASSPLPAPVVAPGIPPHIVAVISAAICATESSRHVIRSVAVAAPTLTWAYEGRSQIFHSHRVR